MQIRLTRRALNDIRKIKATSVERFGELVAEEYLQKIELSLTTIEAHPGLLRDRSMPSDQASRRLSVGTSWDPSGLFRCTAHACKNTRRVGSSGRKLQDTTLGYLF